MDPVIVSFYTNDWEYPAHAERLRHECDGLRLQHHIVEKSSTDYIENTRLKPFVIREAFEKFNRPIWWIDVDGSLLMRPVIPGNYDFAAAEYLNKANLDRDFCVAIMLFMPTVGAKKLLDAWCEYTNVGGTDEYAFDLAWKALRPTVTGFVLPKAYIAIETTTRRPPSPGLYTGAKKRDDVVYLARLSKSESKMSRRNKAGQIDEGIK